MAFSLNEISKDNKKSQTTDFKSLLDKEISFCKGGFNNKKKESFYSELGVLLNAGINLKDSLTLLHDELDKNKDKELVNQILNQIIKGSNFSESIKDQKGFSEYEYYSLKIGEETGTLNKVTQELGLFFRRKNEQRKNLMNAISYPIVVLITAVLSVFFMLKFVVPMFADIFKQNGVELPLLTRVIIQASSMMERYFWVFIFFMLTFIVCIRFVKKKEWYQKIVSRLILKIPFIGELVRKIHLAQFTQAVAFLTGANVPLLNSLELTKKMIDFYPLKTALTEVEKDVIIGNVLSKSLEPYSIFDSRMISLIRVAEETNQNEYIFEKLTVQYNEDVQHKSKMLSTILEPIIIVVLGSLVALILISMYLPMFKLSTVLG